MEAECAARTERALDSIIRRLPRLRDETLYALVRDGETDLPPCDADLTETDRWNIVHYVRSREAQRPDVRADASRPLQGMNDDNPHL